MAEQYSTSQVPQQGTAPDVEQTVTPLKSPAEYTRRVDMERHTVEEVEGRQTHVTQETKTDDNLSGNFDNRVMTLIDGAIQEREQRENVRANHRNMNRFLTLLGAIVLGFLITWLTTTGKLPKQLAPYSFAITVLMDAAFVGWSFIKKY